MSTLTIQLPDPLDATVTERIKSLGVASREEYLLQLVESDCAAGSLERVLEERMAGPFEPLEADWQDLVRKAASRLA